MQVYLKKKKKWGEKVLFSTGELDRRGSPVSQTCSASWATCVQGALGWVTEEPPAFCPWSLLQTDLSNRTETG
jgi:hypothetical protein